jgi:cellulose synthase/poly-beta-1,6-N-acetylglucosamine synthase-like glycosyltransferase
MKYLFWSLFCYIFYVYFGYPIVLMLLSICRHKTGLCGIDQVTKTLPGITLLISAYNEEGVIEEKIHNSLDLEYPKDLLEIIVVSDGSTDLTNNIVSRYLDSGIKLRHYPERSGKTACLNQEVPLAAGKIIVFSDANSKYTPTAIASLVSHFADKEIGFVTGTTVYSSGKNKSGAHSIGLYAKLESFTKRLESKIGCCVGADGAIFAIRQHLYRPLKDSDINDLVIPFEIVKQGFKGVLETKAFCVEEIAENPGKEFDRQVRITARTIRAIANNLELLNPVKYGLFSFELFSHKCSKLLVPFALLLLFFVNVMIVSLGPIYLLSLIVQTIFYMLSLVGHIWKKRGNPPGIVSIPEMFVLVNLAILLGWLKTLKGESYTVWTTIRTN